MIDRSELKIGDVVRLASGSPKLVVEGFPGATNSNVVSVVGWGDRVGFVSETVLASSLVWPRATSEPEAPNADA